METVMMARLASLVLLLAPASAFAADGIVVTRSADSEVFGNCVPSLKAENRSGETVGYLEVDIALALASGQTRTVELQSSYRGGISFPIAPGGTALLKQHLDLSPALGASCLEVKARSVARTICETADGKACAAPLSVTP
jgi:hypothetical protein